MPTVSRPAALIVLGLFLAACGLTGDDPEAGGRSGGAGAGRAPGVTEDSIKIGVTYVDLESIKDIVDLDYGDYEATYQALFDDLNDQGGINGRRLDPVFVPVEPVGTESADRACEQLAVEEEVFVTIGHFLNDTVLCHIEKHESAVIGGTMTPERLERAKAPWFTTEPSVDLQTDAIREFNEADLFEDGTFAVFANASEAKLMVDLIKPALDEFGLSPVEIVVLKSPESDQAAAVAETTAIAERFEAAGVTKVLVVGQGAVTWANGLQETSYRPQTLFAGTQTIIGWLNDASGRDLSVLDGAVAADIYGGKVNQFNEPHMMLCLGALRERGIDIAPPTDGLVPKGTPDPFRSAVTVCKNMTLLKALLATAREPLDHASFRAAADDMDDLPMPTSERPYRYGSPPHADGDAPISIFDFDSEQKYFVRRPTGDRRQLSED